MKTFDIILICIAIAAGILSLIDIWRERKEDNERMRNERMRMKMFNSGD